MTAREDPTAVHRTTYMTDEIGPLPFCPGCGPHMVNKSLDKAEKSGASLSSMFGKMAIAAGVATGAFLSIKMVMAFGREGALISQTTESFGFLIEKIGAAPDLLDQHDVALGVAALIAHVFAGGELAELRLPVAQDVRLDAGDLGHLLDSIEQLVGNLTLCNGHGHHLTSG